MLVRSFVAVLGLTLVLVQLQLWSPSGGLPQMWQLRTAVAEREAGNERLRQRNTALNADVVDLKGGLGALEERARSELGMIRQGEVFYQVADE